MAHSLSNFTPLYGLGLIVLILIDRTSRTSIGTLFFDHIMLRRILYSTIVFSFTDIISCLTDGRDFRGARAIIQISNMIYMEALVFIAYFWMIYVYIRLKKISYADKKTSFFRMIPLIIFSVVALSNPVTEALFSIDKNNCYKRGYAIFLHWIIVLVYLVVTTVKTIRAIAVEENKLRRQEIKPLIYFIIAPVIASVFQMLFYGVSSLQVGITLSLLMISIESQNDQILTDSLTGLNNRRALDKYLEDCIQHNSDKTFTFIMMDINNFKRINDKPGHITGDCALRETADVIRRVCAELSGEIFVCRYGGDEFLLAGYNRGADESELIKQLIRKALEKKNHEENMPYVLELSVGVSRGKCSDGDDMMHLLRVADEAMYNDKKCIKAAHK